MLELLLFSGHQPIMYVGFMCGRIDSMVRISLEPNGKSVLILDLSPELIRSDGGGTFFTFSFSFTVAEQTCYSNLFLFNFFLLHIILFLFFAISFINISEYFAIKIDIYLLLFFLKLLPPFLLLLLDFTYTFLLFIWGEKK